jgi:uroporphyrinogen-III synthase
VIKRLLLTRPAGFNGDLLTACQQLGCQCYEAPLIRIAPLPAPIVTPEVEVLAVARAQIYTSQNAITHAEDALLAIGRDPLSRVYAVGPATQKHLEGLGIAAIAPESPGSEPLLALPDFQDVDGLSITIVTGLGGRDHLDVTLRARGANVARYACYAREKIHRPDLENVVSKEGYDHVLVTSVDLLDALTENLSTHLRAGVTVCATSPRIAEAAIDRGYRQIISAQDASVSGILRALGLASSDFS